MPVVGMDYAHGRRDWLPVAASALWGLLGLAVGVLLGWAIRG